MQEEGIIVKIKDGLAIVQGKRKVICEGCSSVRICSSGAEKDEVLIHAQNKIGACVGDKVIVEVQASLYLKSHILAYLLPVTALLGGGATGVFLSGVFEYLDEDILSVFFAITFFSLSLMWLYKTNKGIDRDMNSKPDIISIIR